MTNRKILIFFYMLSILFTFAITYKLHDNIINLREQLKSNEKFVYKNFEMIDNLDNLSNEDNAWYTKYHFISHSGGGINGRIYSNSLEAWNLSYENGNRVIDADLMFTNDNKLIVKHDGINLELNNTLMKNSKTNIDSNGTLHYIISNSDDITYNFYMNSKIYNKYTPIDCKMLIEYLYNHKDLYIAIDMKDDIKKSYNYFYNMVKDMHMEEVLDRVIVSINDEDSYNEVKKIYNFKNYTMRQYENNKNYYELAKFCTENNIHTLNISQKYATAENIKSLENKGIHVYIAVIDYISDLKYWKDKGASGVISNWLYEEDWNIS